MNKRSIQTYALAFILPIFVLMLFSIYDIGMIVYNKNTLESVSNDVILMINNDNNINEINSKYSDIDVNINDDGEYYNITLSKRIRILTPGLNLILDDPYEVKVERIIPNGY